MGTIDLTANGSALDWIKPGSNTTDLSFAEKNATSLLTLTQVGTANLQTFGDDGYRMSWSGGDANSPSGSSFQGVRVSGVALGVGFRLTLQVTEAGPFTINWYSAANAPEKWTLTGTVGTASDSKTPQTLRPGNNGVDELFWSISGVADAAGDIVTLNLVSNTGTGTNSLAVTGANAVPEPTTGLLVGLAGLTLGLARRRSR